MAKGSRWTLCTFSLLFLATVVGIRLAAGSLTVWYMIMATGILGSAFAFAAVPLVALSWKLRFWSLPELLHYTATTIAALGYVWFLSNWNLLSFRLA